MSKQSHTTPSGSVGPNPFEAGLSALTQAMDPFGMMSSQFKAQLAWARHPQELWNFSSALTADLLKIYGHGARRMLGIPEGDPEPRNPSGQTGLPGT